MKFLNIITLLMLVLGMAACEDHRNDNMPPSLVYIVEGSEELVQVTIYKGDDSLERQFGVYCGGLDGVDVSVDIAVDQSILKEYNQRAGTSYSLLPQECYELTRNKVDINGGEHNATFSVIFDALKLSALTDEDNYILPLKASTEGNVKMNDNKSFILINPVLRTPAIVLDQFGVINIDGSNVSGIQEYVVTLTSQIVNLWDVDIEIVSGEQAVEQFNTEKLRNLQNIPSNAVTVSVPESMSKGVSEAQIKITVDTDKLPSNAIVSAGFILKSVTNYDINEDENYYFVRFAREYPEAVQELDRGGWSIAACNSAQDSGNNKPENILDGDPSTIWQPRYTAADAAGRYGSTFLPFIVDVDMGGNYKLAATNIYRRDHDTYSKDTRAGYIELSKDNITWIRVAEYNYGEDNARGPLYHFFEEYECRYIRFAITGVSRESASSDPASLAELNGCIYK